MSMLKYLPATISMEDAEKQRRVEDMNSLIQKVIQVASDPNWKLLKEKEAYKVFWMRSDESPIVFVKGEGVVDASAAEIFAFLQDMEKATSIDPMYREGKVVLDLGNKQSINYAAFNMPPLISARDFVFHGVDVILENGVGLSVGKSVELDELPPRSGFVRASINTTGYIYTPLADDPSKCFVQYVVNVDPKGWLPTWIVNMAAADQGSNVKSLQDYFAKAKGAKENQ